MEIDNNTFYHNKIINSKTNLMKIEVDKEFYFKGETVVGNVILDVLFNITLSEITISFYMNENWLIQETSTVKYGEKNNQLLSKFDLGINKILNNNNEIKTLSPGRYVFPFKIELPSYLQPSFEYPIPNREAYLRYSLESEIISKDIKLNSKLNILIKSNIKILNNQSKIYSSVANVHKWGMFDGGTTVLKVSMNKNNYKIDELAQLNIEIDNNRGKLKVQKCKIRAIRSITFKRLNKESKEEYPLEKTINSEVFFSEVEPYSKRSFLFQIGLKDNDFVSLEQRIPYPNINDINVLLPSMEGRIIMCEYKIQVSLYFSSFVTSGYRPRVCMPISITHQSQEENSFLNQSNIQKEIVIQSNNNNMCYSSLLYNDNHLGNNNMISRSIEDIENLNYENEKNNKNINNSGQNERVINNINKQDIENQNYSELKEESFYNINEI